jgi:hypothetical protein
MSYLELVNGILTRLRERKVSSINETPYSSMIAVLINDAKETVENAWNWSGLRTTLTTTTTSGVFNYELNGSQNVLTILDVISLEENIFLKEKGAHDFNRLFLSNNVGTGSPYWYSFNGISADGDTQIDFYPIPDAAYTIMFNCVLRTGNLTENADTFLVPTKPIELLTYALAVEERGEDGGASPVSAYARANNALQDAITLDSNKHSEELIWYES